MLQIYDRIQFLKVPDLVGSEVRGKEEVQSELSPVQHGDLDWTASRQYVGASALKRRREMRFGPNRWQDAWLLHARHP
jgi:hypothetical protein